MTTLKSLPARPSLESLRKRAKRLARHIADGDAEAIARARAQLPDAELPLSHRDAQLVLAREYGFAGWQQLLAEVHDRLGQGLEWAASRARQIIHDDDVEKLKELLAEHPALLSWRADRNEGGLLGMATTAFGDAGDAEREGWYTRAACAEVLIDAGAVVPPAVCEGLVASRAKGLLALFERKGLLPRTLKFRVALGDLNAVRTLIDSGTGDFPTLHDAFDCACRFAYEDIASLLLDRLIALDAELGGRIDTGPGREAFIQYLVRWRVLDLMHVRPGDPWQAFVMQQLVRTIHDKDLVSFVQGLRRDAWLLGDSHVDFQVGLVERATGHGCETFIAALLDLAPALLRRRPPPPSQALEFAFTCANTHLLPMLTRIWPVPDDLAHAAGMGDFERVKAWFDASGKPALGDLAHHYPCNDARGEPRVQQVLDTALAWAVLNRHFDVADFLLQHGADINTRWGSHEPASLLHEMLHDYELMQFLIDRGIDMTITDYRWGGTAADWARYANKDEAMARWLEEAERRRTPKR
jgi:hypothetical protein